MKCIPECLRIGFLIKRMRRRPDFLRKKCAAGKTYQKNAPQARFFD